MKKKNGFWSLCGLQNILYIWWPVCEKQINKPKTPHQIKRLDKTKIRKANS